MKDYEKKARKFLSCVYDIMRECSYEYDECDTAKDCIENLIQDIEDNIDDYIDSTFC